LVTFVVIFISVVQFSIDVQGSGKGRTVPTVSN